MKNIADINLEEAISYVTNYYKKTTKLQRILFVAAALLLISCYFFAKSFVEKRSIAKQAKRIVTVIAEYQKENLEKDKRYKKDIFADTELAGILNVYTESSYGDDFSMGGPDSMRSMQRVAPTNSTVDYSVGQSGDFYIENDADNGCVVLKYKRNTSDKTVFYASFEKPKVFCQGAKCRKQATNEKADLCYLDGTCFQKKLVQARERSCGNGHGKQTRECKPSCEGGSCEPWSECVCQRGFGWDGKTCKQLQTEKDCTFKQCFNGIYCEEKEELTKEIENGSCKRVASCQQNKGFLYTSWECSCKDESLCPSDGTCVTKPEDKDEIILEDEGSCKTITYQCSQTEGWLAYAKSCVCNKPGTFWDPQTSRAKCSACTVKPENADFTGPGKNKDNCPWECKEGYQNRKGDCVKPDGQFLCAKMENQICTDDFSKSRKLKTDAKTNEGQLCFVEDKENILFFNKKDRICQICQCVDLTTNKLTNPNLENVK